MLDMKQSKQNLHCLENEMTRGKLSLLRGLSPLFFAVVIIAGGGGLLLLRAVGSIQLSPRADRRQPDVVSCRRNPAVTAPVQDAQAFRQSKEWPHAGTHIACTGRHAGGLA